MQQAILVVSIGTRHLEQKRKCIDPYIDAIRRAYPNWQVYESFTSNLLRRRIKEEGNIILSPEEILNALRRAGCQRVVIQPLFMMAGNAYQKLLRMKFSYAPYMYITIGKPLLSETKDYQEMALALKQRYENEDVQLLLLGHGNSAEANKVYQTLQVVAQKYLPGTLVVTVEERNKISCLPLHSKRVVIVPFMLGIGSEVLQNVFNQKEALWCKCLEADGCQVMVEQNGIVEIECVKHIFIRHIESQINK